MSLTVCLSSVGTTQFHKRAGSYTSMLLSRHFLHSNPINKTCHSVVYILVLRKSVVALSSRVDNCIQRQGGLDSSRQNYLLPVGFGESTLKTDPLTFSFWMRIIPMNKLYPHCQSVRPSLPSIFIFRSVTPAA